MTHRPSRPLTLALGLAVGLAAAGCWQPGSAPLAPAALQVTVPGEGSVTAFAHLAPTDAEGRQLLALVAPWKKADLHHVRVSLYEGSAVTALVSRDVAQADLDTALTFNNLKRNTSYRLVAQAWSDAAEASRVDNGAADAASCTTSFTTTSAEKLEVGALKLKLKAKTFAGATSGSAIDVTDGTLAEPTATETAALLPPRTASTYAGTGTDGFVDGLAAAAQFSEPRGEAIDAQGNLYVADSGNNRIRKITPNGIVSTLAGDGTAGFVNGTGAGARFDEPFGIAAAPDGTVYVADNHCVRKITPAGVVTTLAGNGEADFADGTGADARFAYPAGMTVDASGNVLVADQSNHCIRKVTPAGVVTTLAGNGEAGLADGPAADARFLLPMGVAVDAQGNVYITDRGNNRICKLTPAGVVSTLAGDGTDGLEGFVDGPGAAARFKYPYGIAAAPDGTVYVGDAKNNRIRKITPAGEVSTFAGDGTADFAEGVGEAARFNGPRGMAIDAQGKVYVADTWNHRIRRVR